MLLSRYLGISSKIFDDYGAVNIDVTRDVPLYIDPSLIITNSDIRIRSLYDDIVKYLTFLYHLMNKDISKKEIEKYCAFSEIKNNWLGSSQYGNNGRGLGKNFAYELYNNISKIFSNNNISHTIHIERLSFFNIGVGKDKISDFIVNLIKEYLLEYTEKFAYKYLQEYQCKKFLVDKVYFDYDEKEFKSKTYYLPYIINSKEEKEFILLTPKSILRKGEPELCFRNILRNIDNVLESIPNEKLREEFQDNYINNLNEEKKVNNEENKQKTITMMRNDVTKKLIKIHPELIDYFFKYKEENVDYIKDAEKERDSVILSYNNELTELDLFNKDEDITKYKSTYSLVINKINYFINNINCNKLKDNFIRNNDFVSEKSIQDVLNLVFINTISFNKKNIEDVHKLDKLLLLPSNLDDSEIILQFKIINNLKINELIKSFNERLKKNEKVKLILVVLCKNENDISELLKYNDKNIEIICINCHINEE